MDGLWWDREDKWMVYSGTEDEWTVYTGTFNGTDWELIGLRFILQCR